MPTTATLPRHPPAASGGTNWLQASMRTWAAVVVAGQLVFAVYVAAFYGRRALAGQPERWNDVLPRGWDPTEPLANAVLAAHLLLAVVIVLAGALQLVPWLRRAVPVVHRVSGRAYLLAATVLALGGLFLVWVRGGAAGDLSQHLAISVNALLVLGCAAQAWRAARVRDLARHRRWALRLFVSASGVWFFRVGLMAWLGWHRAPVGFDPKTFSGPFLTVLAWGVYALGPLLVLEAVLRAQAGTPRQRQAAAVLLAAVTAVTAFGVVVATLGMWGPRLA